MSRKFVLLSITFIILLISSIFITKHHFEREYKIDAFGDNYDFDVTEFNVITEDDLSLSMFDTSFYVDVTIKGIARNELSPVFISYVHKSERFDTVDGKKVVIIEFTPVLSKKCLGIRTKKFTRILKNSDIN